MIELPRLETNKSYEQYENEVDAWTLYQTLGRLIKPHFYDNYEVDNKFLVPHGYLNDEKEEKNEDEEFEVKKKLMLDTKEVEEVGKVKEVKKSKKSRKSRKKLRKTKKSEFGRRKWGIMMIIQEESELAWMLSLPRTQGNMAPSFQAGLPPGSQGIVSSSSQGNLQPRTATLSQRRAASGR